MNVCFGKNPKATVLVLRLFTIPDMRYIHDKGKFLKYAYEVFGDYFEYETQFIEQFERIENDKQKNLFLKISSFYKFLVRDGEFLTNVDGSSKVVDYLDQTYKFIALISFIEALYIGEEYIDFYQWLIGKKRRGEIFPINDIEALKKQYSKYKSAYGAAQKAERFFGGLDKKAQDYIRSRITINGDRVGVSDLAKKLYDIRSEFVHKARLIVEFTEGTMISKRRKKQLVSSISMENLQLLFEDALLQFFGFTPHTRKI